MFASYLDGSNFFRRPFYEQEGYAVKEKDGKMYLKVNVLGLGKDDLEIKVDSTENPNHQILTVKGEKNDDLFGNFKVNNRFYLHKRMKTITPIIENGLLTLEIEFEEPVKPDVVIKW